MPILVKGDEVRNGTKANTHHSGLQPAQPAHVSMGYKVDYE